jgi:hypothetical protein
MTRLVAELRMRLCDRSHRIWSDDALEQCLEAVCIERYIDPERRKNHDKILWAATSWAIGWMLEEPPNHLSPLHITRYRLLRANAGDEAERAVHVRQHA